MRVGLVLLVIMTSTAMAAELPRLAIISFQKDSPTADLVFSKLAERDKVALVERARLKDVLMEKERSAFTRDRQMAVGGLLKADGLLVLEQEGELLQVRLVETQKGQVLEVFAVNMAGPEQRTAGLASLVKQVEAVAGKLALPQGERLYVAVMPLVPETAELEKRLILPTINTLLNVQLSRYGSLMLVEREALAAVQVEKDLEAQTLKGLAAADYILRGRATLQKDGQIQVRYQVQRNGEKGQDAPVVEAVLNPLGISKGTLELSGSLAKSMMLSAKSAPASLKDEAASLFALGAYHAAAGRNLYGLRYLECAHLLAPRQIEYADVLINMYAVQMGKPPEVLKGLESNQQDLDRRLDLFLRAVQTAEEADSRYFESDIRTFLVKSPFLTTIAEATALKLSPEQESQASLARQMLRNYLLKRVGIEGFYFDDRRDMLFFDDPGDLFKREIAVIEKSNFGWHHNNKYINHPAGLEKEWNTYLTSLLATNRPLKAQLFGVLGLAGTPETSRRLLDWLLVAPEERSRVLWAEPFGRDILIAKICTQPQDEWPGLVDKLILQYAYNKGWLHSYDFDVTYRWNDKLKEMEKMNNAAGVRVVRQIQLKYLAYCENPPDDSDKSLKEHFAKLAVKMRAYLFKDTAASGVVPPKKSPADNQRNGTGEKVSPSVSSSERCPPLADGPFPGSQLVFDSKGQACGRVQGARTLYDGELFWCAVRGETDILVTGLGETKDKPVCLSMPDPVPAGTLMNGSSPVSMAVWRDMLYVAGSQRVHFFNRTGGNKQSLPALADWAEPGGIGDEVASISSLVGGPDALYIGVVWLRKDEQNAVVTKRGAIFRWTPDMTAPQKICSSDGLGAGPLNNALPYSLEDGVQHPGEDSVLFFLKGNPGTVGTLTPMLYEAGQREGVWKYTPKAGTWTYLHSRFPYERLLRTWKPLVAKQGGAASIRGRDADWSLLAGPRDPAELDSVAVRALPQNSGWESEPQFSKWPMVMGHPVQNGHYSIVRTDGKGEVTREYARCHIAGLHTWLDALHAKNGAFLALREADRLRVWYFSFSGTEGKK